MYTESKFNLPLLHNFIVIAAFMPTYGPFMMVRFCAAIGIGGAFPSASSYLCEITPLSSRARAIAFLCTLGISGGIFAGAVAMSMLPLTGQMVVMENKQHFSAWHRYLLLLTIIPIISTILLFWLPESPRYLLGKKQKRIIHFPLLKQLIWIFFYILFSYSKWKRSASITNLSANFQK